MKRFTIIAIACLMTMGACAQTFDLDSMNKMIDELRIMTSNAKIIELNEKPYVGIFSEDMDRAIYECSAELASKGRANDTLYFKGALLSNLPMPEKNLQVIIDGRNRMFTFRFVNYDDYKFVAYTGKEFEVIDSDSVYEWVEKSRKPVYKMKDNLYWRSGYEKIVANGKTYYAYTNNIPEWRKEKVHDHDIVHYTKRFMTKEELLASSSMKGYRLNEFQFRLHNDGLDWRPSEPIKLSYTGEAVVLSERELYDNLYNLSNLIEKKLAYKTMMETKKTTEKKDKKVVSVEYYNVKGEKSSKPFHGVNIEVTTYDDDSTMAKKIENR